MGVSLCRIALFLLLVMYSFGEALANAFLGDSMVDKDKIYFVMSTIAVIIEKPIEQLRMDQKELEEILHRPVTIGQSPEGLVISSQRDQLEITVSPIRINVRDLSGTHDFEKCKIPEVLLFMVQKFEASLSSYGVNFLMNLPYDADPGEWIRDNILSENLAAKTGKKLLSGKAGIQLESGHKQWNIRLDSTNDGQILIDFNAHEEAKELPGKDSLITQLKEQHDGLLEFLNSLGL